MMGAALALVAVIMLLACGAMASQVSYAKNDLWYAVTDGTDIAVAIANHMDTTANTTTVVLKKINESCNMSALCVAASAGDAVGLYYKSSSVVSNLDPVYIKIPSSLSALCVSASAGDAIWDYYQVTMNKSSILGHYGGREDVPPGNRPGRLMAA